MERLTFTMENYLEAVYELSVDNTGSRVSDIAFRLNVSKASVNNAMNVLAKRGLVEYEKYREIILTAEGHRLAKIISEKHTIIKHFLITALGVDKETADTDACAIEHVISSLSVDKMNEFMEYNQF
jgi:DtxR family transcriptional regulator, Mn-dependent transcriptional regulator